jgi:Cu/Ag efflux protein CusF
MKTKRNLAAVILAALCLAVLAGVAVAEEKASGIVKSIDLATNTVVITTYERQDVTITISAEDTHTLKKLKENLIRVGDDVKAKYVKKDGKNVATFFRLRADCI